MKRKTIGLAAFVLTAALSLTACGVSPDASAAVTVSGGNYENAVRSGNSGAELPAIQANGGAELPAIQAETLDVSASAETFEDAFSSRDLSGTWDAASAVLIALNGSSVSCDSDAVTVPSATVSGAVATITAAGTYRVTGTLDNGSLIVDAGKEDKVQIVLDDASINSDAFAAIYVKQADKVFLTLADGTVNTLSNGGTFEAIDENNVDGAVFSKDDLTLNGSGKLLVNSPAKHGVVSKDELVITGGTYEITAGGHALSGKDGVGVADGALTIRAGKDGIHAKNDEDSAKGYVYLAGGAMTITAGDDGVTASGLLQMDGGSLSVTASEGMEGNYIRVNNGAIRIQASDDGINAARKSGAGTPTVEINGGDISVTMGPGDTDGIDANGNLIITGGTVSVTGNSTFDIDGTIAFTGGSVIINGQQVDTIPNQMRGGRGGFGAAGGRGGFDNADGEKGGFGVDGGRGGFDNADGEKGGFGVDGGRDSFGAADKKGRRFADAETGATPDMKPDERNAGAADNPNGTQDGVTRRNGTQDGVTRRNGTQDGVTRRRDRDGTCQGRASENPETPSQESSSPDNAAFV